MWSVWTATGCVFLVLASRATVAVQNATECTNYEVLSTNDRSSNYYNYHVMKCDVSIPKGWYRFSGQSGSHMATSCVDEYHCGTQYPGWMRGNHPVIQEGRVNRTVCFRANDHCCRWSVIVEVRNCSGFYVYHINDVPDTCAFRFCGGGKVADCQDNKGNSFSNGDTWHPNALHRCTCLNSTVTCKVNSTGCWDRLGHARTDGQAWVDTDGVTVCRCNSKSITCKTYQARVSLDEGKIARVHGSKWFMSNCSNCTSMDGRITCTQNDIQAFYGRFVVKQKSCYIDREPRCDIGNETARACYIFFKTPERDYFQCRSKNEIVRIKHKCNGISECTDGSDEENCEYEMCKDESGRIWKGKTFLLSSCTSCICNNTYLQCTWALQINMPAYANQMMTSKPETCHAKNCNVTHFLKTKSKTCEALEFRPGIDTVKMAGETWTFKNCSFLFAGSEPTNVCPSIMNRPQCYAYNGGICCNKACPEAVLKEVSAQLRQQYGFTICPNRYQLGSVNDSLQCMTKILPSQEFTCKDAFGRRYAEGSLWYTSFCVYCNCRKGLLTCTKTISTLGLHFWDICSQPECRVETYMSLTNDDCIVCQFNDKMYESPVEWKEGETFFYCRTQAGLSTGCDVAPIGITTRLLDCSAAYPELQNSSIIDSSRYFVCQSGDQVISKDWVCNKNPECYDGSDEVFCATHHCKDLKKGQDFFENQLVGTEISKNCSSINSSWTGTFTAKCTERGRDTMWDDQCFCEDKILVEEYENKIQNANVSSELQKVLEDIIASTSTRFSNTNVMAQLFDKLLQKALVTFERPITWANDNENGLFAETMIYFIRDFMQRNPLRHAYCGYLLRNIRSKALFPLYRTVRFDFLSKGRPPFGSRSRNASLLNFVDSVVYVMRNLYTRQLTRQKTWTRTVLAVENAAPLVTGVKSAGRPSLSTNNTNGTDGTDFSSNFTTSSARARYNCSDISPQLFNSSKRVIVKTLPSQMPMTKSQVYIEIALMGIGTLTMIAAIILFQCLKLKKLEEKIYIHKSLMAARCMADIVYFIDVAFTNRNSYTFHEQAKAVCDRRRGELFIMPLFEQQSACTALAVLQHYFHTAVFTWMSAEAFHLYVMLIKVFVANKKYFTYTFIGWGIPLVIVGVTAAVAPTRYNMAVVQDEVDCGGLKYEIKIERNFCWLNDGFWIYNGPILAVLLVNFVMFFVFLRLAFSKISQRFPDDKLQKAKKGIRCVAALLPLLGIAWLLGFIATMNKILTYIFIIVNSTQGILIPIFHCFIDDQVKEALARIQQKKKAVSNIAINEKNDKDRKQEKNNKTERGLDNKGCADNEKSEDENSLKTTMNNEGPPSCNENENAKRLSKESEESQTLQQNDIADTRL